MQIDFTHDKECVLGWFVGLELTHKPRIQQTQQPGKTGGKEDLPPPRNTMEQ